MRKELAVKVAVFQCSKIVFYFDLLLPKKFMHHWFLLLFFYISCGIVKKVNKNFQWS